MCVPQYVLHMRCQPWTLLKASTMTISSLIYVKLCPHLSGLFHGRRDSANHYDNAVLFAMRLLIILPQLSGFCAMLNDAVWQARLSRKLNIFIWWTLVYLNRSRVVYIHKPGKTFVNLLRLQTTCAGRQQVQYWLQNMPSFPQLSLHLI